MGIVELIELMKSTIQCPSCIHYVFEGIFLCSCGKLRKLDPDAINRIEEAFEVVKDRFVHLQSLQEVPHVDRIHGNGITTKLALQKASED